MTPTSTRLASQPAAVDAAAAHAVDSTSSLPLADRIADVLQDNLRRRRLSAGDQAAWQVMHGVLAYGRELPLRVDGRDVSAVDYLLGGGELAGWELSVAEPGPAGGRAGIKSAVANGSYVSQGHVDQWLAILGQVGIPLDQRVTVAGRELTIDDWVRQSRWDVSNNPYEEYSWTLIASLIYRPDEIRWPTDGGFTGNLDEMAAFEAKQDLGTSACGGSHRLMGLARAARYARERNLTAQAGFAAAIAQVDAMMATMQRYQNADGSLSVNYFERPGVSKDLATVISTTGHQIEVAAYALPAEELDAAWLEKAVVRLCDLLELTADQPLECGGLYHALAGLRIYSERRFPE